MSAGFAFVVTSQSFGLCPKSRSRTHPPTRYASNPAFSRVSGITLISLGICDAVIDAIEALYRKPRELLCALHSNPCYHKIIMQSKVREKEKAIQLRKQGLSYKDILKEIPVAKSSISLWLKDLPLTEEEKKFLKYRRKANITNGRIKAATVLHNKRLAKDRALFLDAKSEFELFIPEPFFGIGLALYWAEGTKRGSGFAFSNSDPAMVRMMVLWIEKYLKIHCSELTARLYTHRPFENDGLEDFWSHVTEIPIANFRKTTYKPMGLSVKKRPNYKGCLRVLTRNSTVNLRKMLFWQSLLIKHFR